MQGVVGKYANGVLEGECENTKDHVDDLEDRNRFDSAIEAMGEVIPEDLRPEEALESCTHLY